MTILAVAWCQKRCAFTGSKAFGNQTTRCGNTSPTAARLSDGYACIKTLGMGEKTDLLRSSVETCSGILVIAAGRFASDDFRRRNRQHFFDYQEAKYPIVRRQIKE